MAAWWVGNSWIDVARIAPDGTVPDPGGVVVASGRARSAVCTLRAIPRW